MGHRDLHSTVISFFISVGKTQGSEAAGPPKKKRKRSQKKSQERGQKAVEPQAQALGEKSPAASQARKPAAAKEKKTSGSSVVPAGEELQDFGQGQLGSMQTRSSLVIRKGIVRHRGITGDFPKSELSEDRSQGLCGWMGSQGVHSGSRANGAQDLVCGKALGT